MKIAADSGMLAAHAAFVASRLGWAGWAGIGALLIGLIALLVGTPLLERAAARDAAQLAELRALLALQADPKAAQRARDPLAALVDTLPSSAQVPDFVAALQRRADKSAVQIDRTEYRVQAVLGKAAQRYRLRFPAHADYPHLRIWLEGLLHDYPSLVLDDISLRRAADGGEELEASIGLSFLARATP